MPSTGIIAALTLFGAGAAMGAAGAAGFQFLPSNPEEAVVAVESPSNNPNMTLAQEIAAERDADLAAANLTDVWLEPADFDDAADGTTSF